MSTVRPALRGAERRRRALVDASRVSARGVVNLVEHQHHARRNACGVGQGQLRGAFRQASRPVSHIAAIVDRILRSAIDCRRAHDADRAWEDAPTRARRLDDRLIWPGPSQGDVAFAVKGNRADVIRPSIEKNNLPCWTILNGGIDLCVRRTRIQRLTNRGAGGDTSCYSLVAEAPVDGA